MKAPERISILGGGPAGLGAGYFLKQPGYTFRIYEAANRVGGNCVTLERSGFHFDSGAHRFHDKDSEITQLVQALMGDELLRVKAPSAIYDGGRFVDFPLSPLNLVRTLGLSEVMHASVDWLQARLRPVAGDHFGALVVNRYGHRLAERFLLNYTEKLWGETPDRLSAGISGGRLKGLTLKTFVLEGLFGLNRKTAHLDGTFLYPRSGYGAIVERLADACGRENISLNHRVTRVLHSDDRLDAIELNGAKVVKVDQVVNTLPLPLFIAQLDPVAPPEVLKACRRLHFRDVLLVGLILDRPRVAEYATLYFPATEYPFTRIYEPSNRSAAMSPQGKTSLLAEVPMPGGAPHDVAQVGRLVQQTVEQLSAAGLIAREEVRETFMRRLPYAYPVLEAGVEQRVAAITDYLSRFDNLFISGRNGRFEYAHLHDMLRWGRTTALALASEHG